MGRKFRDNQIALINEALLVALLGGHREFPQRNGRERTPICWPGNLVETMQGSYQLSVTGIALFSEEVHDLHQ